MAVHLRRRNSLVVSVYRPLAVGSWQLACRSHYWIRRNNVEWSRAFDDEEIEAVLRKDPVDLHGYYERRATVMPKTDVAPPWWRRLFRRAS